MNSEKDSNDNRFWRQGTIEAFQEKMAVILTRDGQKLLWPIKDLPEDCGVGSEVKLILTTVQSDQAERQQIAKTILNEILKNQN